MVDETQRMTESEFRAASNAARARYSDWDDLNRDQQERLILMDRAESAQAPEDNFWTGGVPLTPGSALAGVQQGILDIPKAPGALLSALAEGMLGVGVDDPTASAYDAMMEASGLMRPPEDRLGGALGLGTEILGTSLVPHAGFLQAGNRMNLPGRVKGATRSAPTAMQALPPWMMNYGTPGGITQQIVDRLSAVKSAPGFMARETAKRPIAATGGEVVGSAGAGVGGEYARRNFPEHQFLGEMIGGITAPYMLFGAVPRLALSAGRHIGGGLQNWMQGGAARSAAKTLQGRSPDPLLDEGAVVPQRGFSAVDDPMMQRISAERLPTDEMPHDGIVQRIRNLLAGQEPPVKERDIPLEDQPLEAMVPPMLQTDSPRLWATQRLALEQGPPELKAQMDARLKTTAEKAQQEAVDFPGDTAAVRQAIDEPAENLIANLNRRANEALAEAQDTMQAMRGTQSPRDISRTGRQKVVDSLSQARSDESDIWGRVPKKAEGDYDSARGAYDEIVASRSPNDDPSEIPSYLDKAFKTEAKVRKLRAKAEKGKELTDEEIAFIQDNAVTLNDIHALRKRVGQDWFAEVRSDAPNRNKLRILNDLRDALLDDMSRVDADGVDKAIAFSRALNEKFTKGEIGDLLSLSRTGVAKVDAPLTFETILGEKSASRGIQQLLRGTPDARPELENFVRSRFILQATDERGVMNSKTAERLLVDLRNRGVFEELPELETEIKAVIAQNDRAANLAERAAIVEKRGGARLQKGSNESLASVFAGKPIGQEVDVLLETKNPARVLQLARALRTRMQGNTGAEQGLKRQFAERLVDKATPSRIDPVTGRRDATGVAYADLVNKNQKVLEALGFSSDEIQRLKVVGKVLTQIQRPIGSEGVKNISDALPSKLLDLIARFTGATIGGEAGKSMGSGLVLAQAGSANIQKVVLRIVSDAPAEVIYDSVFDNNLFKALMIKPTDPLPKQERAAKVLKSWLLGAGVQELTGEEDQDQGPQ